MPLLPAMSSDAADSSTIGNILLAALTILLALLVLLLFHPPPLDWSYSAGIPAIFVITSVQHQSDQYPYPLNYDSRIILRHNGTESMKNDDLKAYIYRDGIRLMAAIPTLNGHNFVATHHYGVQWIGGTGSQGELWSPGETLTIDLPDGTLHPGDLVQVDVFFRTKNQIISRHTYTA